MTKSISSSNKIIKNTGFLYGRMAITVFISLYTTRLILNSLGVSDFGVFGIVGGAIGMLSFLDGAMAAATQRFMSFVEGEGDELKKHKVFNVSIVLHIGIAVIVLCMLELASLAFFCGILNIAPDRIYAAKAIYHFMVLSAVFTIITVPFDAAINSHEDMLFYGITGVLESILKLCLAIWITYTSYDKLIVYGLFIAVITVITLVIKQIYCSIKYKECKVQPKQYFDYPLFKEMTHYASWNFMGSMGTVVGNYGSGLVVNHFFGTAVNAAQSVTGQLNGQLLSFSNNMLKALNPVIVKKEGEGNRDSMLKHSLTGCKLSYILLAVFAIPFLVETPFILKLWLKIVPEWTILFCRLFVVTTMIQQFTITFGTTIGATGRIKAISLFSSLISLLPNIVYIILFSLGASPVWLYILILIDLGIFSAFFMIYQCKVKCGLDITYFLKSVVAGNVISTFISLSVAVLLAVLQSESIYRLLQIGIICPIVYLVCTYFFVFNSEEKSIIQNLMKKLILKK